MRALKRSMATIKTTTLTALALLIVAVLSFYLVLPTHAAELEQRSMKLDSTQTSVTTNYTASFTINSNDILGSVEILFCDNSPLVDDICNQPTGFDISAATLDDQTGITDFTIDSTTANSVLLTRTAAAVTPPLPITLTFGGVVNPSSIGSYYGRISTHDTTDGTGVPTNFGGLAFAIADLLSISTEVPPYLLFCTGITINVFDCTSASGDFIQLGNLSSTVTRFGSTQFVVATNAAGGYGVSANGTTLTSGNNVIANMVAQDISRPGVSQFGLNLVANADPSIGQNPVGPGAGFVKPGYNTANRYRFIPGDMLVQSLGAGDFEKFTVSYVANVSKNQAPGVYVSTLTYISLANF